MIRVRNVAKTYKSRLTQAAQRRYNFQGGCARVEVTRGALDILKIV